MPPKLPGSPTQRWPALVALAGLGVAALVLFFFNPAEYGVYPLCAFHQATGLDCPGCGALRATHQLLHGHLVTAFALNPLLFVVGPLLGWSLAVWLGQSLFSRSLPQPFSRPAWAWSLGVLTIAFGIARNLPWFHAFLDPR